MLHDDNDYNNDDTKNMCELIQWPPVLHNQASCADREGKVGARAEWHTEGTSHKTHG
jgi:hypothetical protein